MVGGACISLRSATAHLLVLRGRGGGTALERGGRQPPGRQRAAGSRGNLLSPAICQLALNGRRRLVKGLGPVRWRLRDAAADDRHDVGRAADEPCSPPHWVGRRRPPRTPKRSRIWIAKQSKMRQQGQCGAPQALKPRPIGQEATRGVGRFNDGCRMELW